MWRFGELYFFQGGTAFCGWKHREIFMRRLSARIHITHILEIRLVVAAATDLLKFFESFEAHHHLKIAL